MSKQYPWKVMDWQHNIIKEGFATKKQAIEWVKQNMLKTASLAIVVKEKSAC